jgi:hypothetical protein
MLEKHTRLLLLESRWLLLLLGESSAAGRPLPPLRLKESPRLSRRWHLTVPCRKQLERIGPPHRLLACRRSPELPAAARRLLAAVAAAVVATGVDYILYSIFYFPTNHTKLAMTRQIFNFSCGENDSYPS